MEVRRSTVADDDLAAVHGLSDSVEEVSGIEDTLTSDVVDCVEQEDERLEIKTAIASTISAEKKSAVEIVLKKLEKPLSIVCDSHPYQEGCKRESFRREAGGLSDSPKADAEANQSDAVEHVGEPKEESSWEAFLRSYKECCRNAGSDSSEDCLKQAWYDLFYPEEEDVNYLGGTCKHML